MLDRFSGWEQIGRGSSGTVYRARDDATGREVAVKVLRAGPGDAQAVARFRREAAAMSSVRHPGVVRIDEIVEADDELALVMELVDGLPLQVLLSSMTPPQAVGVLAQMGASLDAIHATGVVHRDLKPANVLVDTSGRCRIADFGVARFIGESMHAAEQNLIRTRTGVVIGTPAYLAPEIAAGRPVDHRADVYSLGVVAYHMLVGRTPFEGGLYQLLEAHISAPVPRPEALVPGFPSTVAEVLVAALGKDPDARPRSAGQLTENLVAAAPDVWRNSSMADVARLVAAPARPGPTARPTGGPTMATAATVLPAAEPVSVALPRSTSSRRLMALVATAVVAAAAGVVIALLLIH